MSADTPRVSVVMPCFNAARYVEEAVRSALEQTCRDVELLVIDDGSDDGSADVLRRLQGEFGDQRLRLLATARLGPYPARNLGLREARGEFIAFLDADDWWEPDFIASMLAAIDTAGVDIAYCGWQNVGTGGPRDQPYVPPAYEDGDPVAQFLETCPWPIHAAVVRRRVIDVVGGFSERLFSSMDYDLWIRLLGATQRMVRVPRVLAYYRWHGSGQISAIKWRQVLHAWQVRHDFIVAHPALVAHLGRSQRRELVEAALMRQARTLFWRRDLDGAQQLLRHALGAGGWRLRDLPLLGAARLPLPWFRRLVSWVDRGDRGEAA